MNNLSSPFVIIDTETTGLYANRSDRIIEIAIVKLDSTGTVIDEFSTLVNPNRDVGPVSIHGLSAAHLFEAPLFEEIAGEIFSRIDNSVIVGHNVLFDTRFLAAEYRRLGYRLPAFSSLCTISLSAALADDLPSRKLDCCCEHFGIPLTSAHTALADARASAEILRLALMELDASELNSYRRELLSDPEFGNLEICPKVSSKRKFLNRDEADNLVKSRSRTYIARLLDSLPALSSKDSTANSYLELLDRVIEDRRLEERECSALIELGLELGLSKASVVELHERYLADILTAAFSDGQLSTVEKADLEKVQQLLDIPPDRYKELFDRAKEGALASAGSAAPVASNIVGKSVCFTGELLGKIDGKPITRSQAEELARAAGLLVCKGVTKKLDYLVVADPETMSGKAKKARDYGTRIVAEPVLWQLVGVTVE